MKKISILLLITLGFVACASNKRPPQSVNLDQTQTQEQKERNQGWVKDGNIWRFNITSTQAQQDAPIVKLISSIKSLFNDEEEE